MKYILSLFFTILIFSCHENMIDTRVVCGSDTILVDRRVKRDVYCGNDTVHFDGRGGAHLYKVHGGSCGHNDTLTGIMTINLTPEFCSYHKKYKN